MLRCCTSASTSRGHFVAFNETMLRTLGYPREALMGQPYTCLLTPASRHRFPAAIPTAFSGPARSRRSGSSRTAPSSTCWIGTTTVKDAEGQFVRSRSAARDVTERSRLATALQTKAEELRQANSPAAPHQPGAGRVHLRRLARPQGAAAHPAGVQQLPGRRTTARSWTPKGRSTSAT